MGLHHRRPILGLRLPTYFAGRKEGRVHTYTEVADGVTGPGGRRQTLSKLRSTRRRPRGGERGDTNRPENPAEIRFCYFISAECTNVARGRRGDELDGHVHVYIARPPRADIGKLHFSTGEYRLLFPPLPRAFP